MSDEKFKKEYAEDIIEIAKDDLDITHVRHSKLKQRSLFQKFSLNFSISPLHNQYQFSANNFFHINTRLQTNLIFSSQLVLL